VSRIAKPKGAKVAVGDIVGYLEPATPGAVPPPAPSVATPGATKAGPAATTPAEPHVMPAAARVLAERAIPPAAVTPTGPGGRILKEDAERAAREPSPSPASAVAPAPVPVPVSAPLPVPAAEGRPEEVVPLSLIRRKIAERLLAAQNTMALLTTFNEVDMSAILQLRAQFQDKFQERYRIKLGFMSFFVKAVIEALKDAPALNAEIRDQSIVYRNYFDIGVAIGGGRGLVVPVLRHAERLGLAEIEQAIADFAARAKENKLTPAELAGGTFTITNGGVYGSLLSTPLINAPQSGVLGMHAIQDRPVARDGQVVIRPMMYLALTYDHRVVDGREAVTFLRRVKELAEQPARILLEA
jgi:2-oxoglutarate dehydrogenase E2 component (dihydrolipoamide succinyltransferase)